MNSSNKLNGLIEELKKEAYNVERQEMAVQDLKDKNKILKSDLGVALENIRKIETKHIELEQEILHLKTQKQKLKLVVIKLKRKRESDRAKMQSSKKTKITKQSSNIIDLSHDTSNDTTFAEEFHESTGIDFSFSKSPVATIEIDPIVNLPSSSTTEKSPYTPNASDKKKNIPTDQQTKLNPRKKQDRLKMKTKACEHCKEWYGESWQHMKDTCRHKYHAVPPSTPENYWKVTYPKTQDDS